MELFGKNKEEIEKFKKIWLDGKKTNIIEDLIKMNDEIIGSRFLGYILYDEGVFEVVRNIDREFFATNYLTIFEAMKKAGIYDSYTFLLKQVLGNGIKIEYTSSKPRYLDIQIWNIGTSDTKLITNSNLWITTDKDIGILSTKPNPPFVITQLNLILKTLANPSGTYLTTDFHFGPKGSEK
ncbi:hypothetical protein [Aliivibrio fischeri]|uniref:Uncharacterized protein n=1 Tax=Aliivibrio fischeri SR5 TaxID=1088719 RepID=A0AAV3EVB3_ALIFS|nr:hypothetical protein [Aliivibrio fischeri]EHN70916.1 hypothetical protein VFSR5_0696 [Aliivibrio fischeri SR5]